MVRPKLATAARSVISMQILVGETVGGFLNHKDDAIYVDKNLRDVIMLALAFDVLRHVK